MRPREESEAADVSQLQEDIVQLEVSMGKASTRLQDAQGEIVKAEALVAECQRAVHAEGASGKTLATENEKLLQGYQLVRLLLCIRYRVHHGPRPCFAHRFFSSVVFGSRSVPR